MKAGQFPTTDWAAKFGKVKRWWAAQTGRYVKGNTTYQNEQEQCEFELTLELAPLMCELFPSYSSCFRCHWPWPLVESHTTQYRKGQGCFPLCQKCWRELGWPERRLPFYRQLYDEWVRQGCDDKTWDEIKTAVEREGWVNQQNGDNVDLLVERLHALVSNLRDPAYTGAHDSYAGKAAANSILFAMYGGMHGNEPVSPALDPERMNSYNGKKELP